MQHEMRVDVLRNYEKAETDCLSCLEDFISRDAPQSFAGVLQQHVSRERLLNQAIAGDRKVASFIWVEISRHINNAQLRKPGFQLLRELWTAQPGHDDVGNQEVDRIIQSLGNFQRFCAVCSLDHMVAGALEELRRQSADFGFVFCEQDSPNCFRTFHRFYLASRNRGLVGNARQIDFHARTLVDFTLDPNRPAALGAR